jgi:hypothetical protein
LGCDGPCGVARPRKREWPAEKEKKGGRKRGGPVEVWAERPGRGAGPAAMPAQAEKEREAGLRERKRGREEGLGFFQTLSKLCKLHSNKHATMHSNYDAQALIASKIIKLIFKYLMAKFIYSLENKI